MTIRETLKLYRTVENELLLAHVLDKPKEFLFLNPHKALSRRQAQEFQALVKRRLTGEPIAYIVGYKYFCGFKFVVNKNVLIPRPETEWLVERSVEIIRRRIKAKTLARPAQVLDMGTGSGCIAISLAKKTRAAQVEITASDMSGKALAVAKKNARLNKAKIKFVQSDLFNNIRNSYDLVIANLPYVPALDYVKLKTNLKHEPKFALTDDSNDFKTYSRFLSQARNHMNKDGYILMEIDPSFKKSKLAKNLVLYKDLRGLWRYAEYK